MSSTEVVTRDMIRSAGDVQSIVLPILKRTCPLFTTGSLHMVEGRGDPISSILDMYAGIDIIHLSSEGIRGIASRVQYREDYRTFTIREFRPSEASTEMDKRLAALKGEYLYPYYTLQAYLAEEGGPLLSLAVTPTRDLYRYILECDRSGHPLPRRKPHGEGQQFVFVPWTLYQRAGYSLFQYPPSI